MNLRTFIKKKILILIYTEKKLSSNCAKKDREQKTFNSKLLKLYEYVKQHQFQHNYLRPSKVCLPI